jgi:hypothetical protein
MMAGPARRVSVIVAISAPECWPQPRLPRRPPVVFLVPDWSIWLCREPPGQTANARNFAPAVISGLELPCTDTRNETRDRAANPSEPTIAAANLRT